MLWFEGGPEQLFEDVRRYGDDLHPGVRVEDGRVGFGVHVKGTVERLTFTTGVPPGWIVTGEVEGLAEDRMAVRRLTIEPMKHEYYVSDEGDTATDVMGPPDAEINAALLRRIPLGRIAVDVVGAALNQAARHIEEGTVVESKIAGWNLMPKADEPWVDVHTDASLADLARAAKAKPRSSRGRPARSDDDIRRIARRAVELHKLGHPRIPEVLAREESERTGRVPAYTTRAAQTWIRTARDRNYLQDSKRGVKSYLPGDRLKDEV